jgi:hypothetical protein
LLTTKALGVSEKSYGRMKKDHYLTLCKHLPICDPSLGELEVGNASRKAPDVHLLLRFSLIEVIMV